MRRHTEEPFDLLVADNGSTDGTLRALRGLPWLKVFSLSERRNLIAAESKRRSGTWESMNAQLARFSKTISPEERLLLDALRRDSSSYLEGLSEGKNDHGEALDWLAGRVQTPYLITMDSDVEFVAPGWLSGMIDLMERTRLSALGELEPGAICSSPRLAPHLLALRTEVVRSLNVSFRSLLTLNSPDELARWEARSRKIRVDVDELADFPTARLFDCGAALFAALQASNVRWAETPKQIRSKYRHLEHMSWSRDKSEVQGSFLSDHHSTRLAYVRQRLTTLDDAEMATVFERD